MSEQQKERLWNLGFGSIQELETDRGILASGRDELYGCIFGRDSLITALTLLRTYECSRHEYFPDLVEKILLNLGELQGREHNIESGEEPGKIIHEFRLDRHEHLTVHAKEPWYVYPDGALRNYDSADSTPLYLMALHRYADIANRRVFLERMLPNAREALDWLLKKTEGRFVDYAFPAERTCGGLRCQSWMDSNESLFYENRNRMAGEVPLYPIAPLEVQAYAWAALRAWSDVFAESDLAFGAHLFERAQDLKERFNDRYVIRSGRSTTLAFAIDGAGGKLISPRSSMGHVLWAAYRGECILDEQYIPTVARRLLANDLFVSSAGIRTLSRRSSRYDPHSYHNGSIWPHDTAILAEGLQNFGYAEEARRVRLALLRSYTHFSAPIELFAYSRGFREYQPASGQRACRMQAWSAAGLLSALAATKTGEQKTLTAA